MVPKVDYLKTFDLIEKQKKALYERIKSRQYNNYKIYKGIRTKQIKISDIPGVCKAFTQEII
jgi:hypothetical protein